MISQRIIPRPPEKTGNAILLKVKGLGSFPRLGRVFSRLNREDVREIPIPPYRIIYRVKDDERCVIILKVWHGARREPDLQ